MYWTNSWSRVRERSTVAKARVYYYLNLFRYNVQWYISILRYGENKQCQGVQIPFMITTKMQKSLSRLGFAEEDIRTLKPAEAAKIIEHSIDKLSWHNNVMARK